MKAEIMGSTSGELTIQVRIPIGSSMYEGEQVIQEALNEVGQLATGELLSRFDTDGSPIVIGKMKLTSKGQIGKTYQTPYGAIELSRHVYQSSEGGATYCPLEVNTRVVRSSTPLFARQLSSKYARMGVTQVQSDLEENHCRKVAKCMVQSVSEAVAEAIIAKEDDWSYSTNHTEAEVATVGIGMDGGLILTTEDGWREAMTGTIVLYNNEGARLHTTYVGAAPEHGKETFLGHLEREIEIVANRYPNATRIGLADGAKCNWGFLEEYTEHQVIDFYHATQYLKKAADAFFPNESKSQQAWMDVSCHKLKHNINGPDELLQEMRTKARVIKGKKQRALLASAISYFRNNKSKMPYARNVELNLPIGSGVTEAGVKVIIKQRLCQSGMRWKEEGAAVVIRLRTMIQTVGRWGQFWAKVSQFGFPIVS